MSCTLRFRRKVDEDATAVYEWYEERAVGLSDGFLQELHDAAEGLLPSRGLCNCARDPLRITSDLDERNQP